MDEIEFLSLEDVLFAHADQIRRYGGNLGVRDFGMLDSAVAQPQAAFAGKWLHTFPFEMAAAYLYYLVKNHPFVDGNKRTGAVAALLFLDLNDIEVSVPKGALYDITIAIVNGSAGRTDASEFFRVHSRCGVGGSGDAPTTTG